MKEVHLNEEEILRAMVDETDLPSGVREHLAHCGLCRAEQRRLEERLARMTHMARLATPRDPRKPSLILEQPRLLKRLSWGWWGGLSAGLVAAVVVLIAVGSLLSRPSREETAFLTDRETIEDEQLLAEVSKLEQNGFPPLYLEMSGSDDSDAGDKPIDEDSTSGAKVNDNNLPNVESGKVS